MDAGLSGQPDWFRVRGFLPGLQVRILQYHALGGMGGDCSKYKMRPGLHYGIPERRWLQLAGMSLAIWLAISADDVVGKILAIWFPIMAFVTIGFEHSVADMFFIPLGLFVANNQATAATLATANVNTTNLVGSSGWYNFFITNLVPVTLGNIVGAALFVAAIYRYVYMRGPLCSTRK